MPLTVDVAEIICVRLLNTYLITECVYRSFPLGVLALTQSACVANSAVTEVVSDVMVHHVEATINTARTPFKHGFGWQSELLTVVRNKAGMNADSITIKHIRN